MRPKNEGQTKALDHLQTIELEKLFTKLVSKVSEVEGMISFYNFYIFYRILKRWTTGPGAPLGLLLGLPENHEIWSSFSGPDGLIFDRGASN